MIKPVLTAKSKAVNLENWIWQSKLKLNATQLN